jgi:DNA-directed RNA polymerase beta subunit
MKECKVMKQIDLKLPYDGEIISLKKFKPKFLELYNSFFGLTKESEISDKFRKFNDRLDSGSFIIIIPNEEYKSYAIAGFHSKDLGISYYFHTDGGEINIPLSNPDPTKFYDIFQIDLIYVPSESNELISNIYSKMNESNEEYIEYKNKLLKYVKGLYEEIVDKSNKSNKFDDVEYYNNNKNHIMGDFMNSLFRESISAYKYDIVNLLGLDYDNYRLAQF